MSLHLPQDSLSKREKQEIFKKSLDDQRRMKQESASLEKQMRDRPSSGRSGYALGLDRVEFDAIPGSDHRQRLEDAASPREKQPYMSALSEMKGRSLQVRRQEFEKESRYRNMLMAQIEENKQRKEAERAKLEEEKRRELEEIQRLEVNSAPRRQQLAQFQESPDHPLPSPTRRLLTRHQVRQHMDDVKAYGREGDSAPVHRAVSQQNGRISVAKKQLDDDGWDARVREDMSSPGLHCDSIDRVGHHRSSGGTHPQARRVASSGQIAGLDRLDAGRHEQYEACAGRRGCGQGGSERDSRGAAGDNLLEIKGLMERDSAAGKPSLEWRDSAGPGSNGGDFDVVSRADFDELSNLCRDLLLEQKHLRRRLEECEERGPRAERVQMRGFESGVEERGERRHRGSGTAAPEGASTGGVRRRRSRQADESHTQGNCVRENGLRRENGSKPGVAFGSTVPRSGQPRTVGSIQASRNGRDQRMNKRDPLRRQDDFGVRHSSSRNAVSTKGAGDREPFVNHRSPDSEWRSLRRTTYGSLVGHDESLRGWAPREELGKDGNGSQTSGTRGRGTIHDLNGISGPEVSSRYQTGGYDDLGGQSTFLSANPS